MAWATETEMNNIFGYSNIQHWADIENTSDPLSLSDRIAWALVSGDDELRSRIIDGPYSLEFVNVPTAIIRYSSMRAGLFLFDTRRIVTDETEDQVSRQRKDYDNWVRSYHRGQVKLYDPISLTSLEPQVRRFPAVSENTRELCG